MELKAVLFLQYSRLALTRLVPAAFAAAAGFAGAQSPAAAAPQETVLYSFGTGKNDGANPQAGVISGANGALYGTTAFGGPSDSGTVFQLTPPAKGLAQWTETVLYRFQGGNDGDWPDGGLIFGENGALYGTTSAGGTSGQGTVFQLTPPATGQTQWTESVLYSFKGGKDGRRPLAGLIFGNNGALYGTTLQGGTTDNGTVFQLTPPATGLAQWTETVLHSFTGGNDGANPIAGVIFGKDGALYGTTDFGGTSGSGTAFQLTPPATGQTQWTETVLYSFTGGNDAGFPDTCLVSGKDGALYGAALKGTLNQGTVFKLTPPAAGQTAWSETVLHSFGAPGDGTPRMSRLIFGGGRALYGTTGGGGASDNGTVFQLTQ